MKLNTKTFKKKYGDDWQRHYNNARCNSYYHRVLKKDPEWVKKRDERNRLYMLKNKKHEK